MHLSPDAMIFWQHGFFKLNATIVFTWGLMSLLSVGSILITRKLSTDLQRSRWQNLLEIVVTAIEKQIKDVGLSQPRAGFIWLLTGGILYSSRIVFYALDHRYPWMHGAWHLFVLAGSISHYVAILVYV
ncbi:MAG: hypothetical protein WBN08_15680 [Thiogranum sp.]